MEMESEELLYDDDQNAEEEVDHDLAGVDVDGLLGDDDQSMAGQSDGDPALVAAEGEEVFDTNCEESTEYAEEEEYQGDAEITDDVGNAEENAEESMDQELDQEQTKQPNNEVSGSSPSNVCCLF